MHFVIIFVAVTVVLWVAVTPIFEFYRKKKRVDKAFRKRMFMDTDSQKIQFKEATKKLMEDE